MKKVWCNIIYSTYIYLFRAFMLGRVWLSVTPWTVAHQLLCPLDSPGKNTGSGLPCPTLGDLPDSGIKPKSPGSPALQADSLPTEPSRKPNIIYSTYIYLLRAFIILNVVNICVYDPFNKSILRVPWHPQLQGSSLNPVTSLHWTFHCWKLQKLTLWSQFLFTLGPS